MSTLTPNLGLIKNDDNFEPWGGDVRYNWDLLDTIIGDVPDGESLQGQIDAINIQITNILNILAGLTGGLYGATTGTNTYAATIAGITGYVTGVEYRIRFMNANTDDSTLNINALGAVPIRNRGAALVAGDLVAGGIAELVYDGATMQLIGPTDDFNVLDTTAIYLRDDFASGNSIAAGDALGPTGKSFGELGWAGYFFGVVTDDAIVGIGADFPHLGILRIGGGAVAGNGAAIALHTIEEGHSLAQLGATAGWDSEFIFRINQTTDINAKLGYCHSPALVDILEFFGIRYDTDTDTAFQLVTRTGGVETLGPTYPVNTNWHKLRVRSLVAGTILFTFDANSEVAMSATVPAGRVTAFAKCKNLDVAEGTLDMDLFAFQCRGLVR